MRTVDAHAAAVWVLVLCLVTAGCAADQSTPPAGGRGEGAQTTAATDPQIAPGQEVSLVFQSRPDPPRSGDNAIEVTVKGADGAPVTDATVTTVFSMPAMPSMNMPAMRTTTTLTHDAAGRYRGTGQLSMAGTWNVIVTVLRGTKELGRKSFSIVAR
jgi:hypothetical protein